MFINTSTWWWPCKAETRRTDGIKWVAKLNFDGLFFTLLCISPSRMFILYTSCRQCLILDTIRVIGNFLGLTFLLLVDGGAALGVPASKRAYWSPIIRSNLWVSLCIWTWRVAGLITVLIVNTWVCLYCDVNYKPADVQPNAASLSTDWHTN